VARAEIGEVVLGSTGAPVAGASVQVNVRAGGAATVYQAESGGTQASNPITTDSAGRIDGWLDEGSYDLVVTATGLDSYTQRFEAVAGANVPGKVLTTTGDVAYASAANTLSRLAVGSAGQVLTVAGGVPSWAYPAAAVATTIGGLSTAANGRIGRLRLGSTPFDFLTVIYDSTYAKWVSEAELLPLNEDAISTNATTYAGAAEIAVPVKWADYDAAGLKPQVRWRGQLQIVGGGTASIVLGGKGVDEAGALSALVDADKFAATEETTTAAAWVVKESAWHEITGVTVEDYLLLGILAKHSTGANLAEARNLLVELRWAG
jgi:hypothetical protein